MLTSTFAILAFVKIFLILKGMLRVGSIHSLPEDCLPELAQLLKSRSADETGKENIWPP